MKTIQGTLLAVAIALSACSSDDDGDPDAFVQLDATDRPEDAGEGAELVVPPDAETRTVEIGTGADSFVAMSTAEMVVLTQGPQGGGRWGGFHIWHAVRTKGFEPDGVTLRFGTRLASNQEVLASQERRVDLLSDGTGHFIAYGIAPAFLDCCLAAGNEVVMAVEIIDNSGLQGSDEQTVRAGDCRDFEGTDLCL